MTAAETSEYAQFSAEKVQRGLEIVQDTIERAEEFATAENVQRGIDFIQDKIERVEGVAVLVDDIAIAAGTGSAKRRRYSRRGLILGGVIVVGVIVAVVVIRSRSHETAAEEATEDPS